MGYTEINRQSMSMIQNAVKNMCNETLIFDRACNEWTMQILPYNW